LLSQEVLNQFHTDTMKVSFVLFDEIEKASGALWNLLLGVLDKATLTLGDNRAVDFSHAMIFMTSNLGAAEMSAIINPKLGFTARESARQSKAGVVDGKLNIQLARSGAEAARRNFTPEFINRLDNIVTFQPLGAEQLRKVLDIELKMVQQRIFNTSPERSFVFKATDPAKDFMLQQGTDLKYGARHLKRAIERLLVHPMSCLIATEQVRGGDAIRVDFDPSRNCLTFLKEAEGLTMGVMADLPDQSIMLAAPALGTGASADTAKIQTAGS
jgi:ATP-dependent Clp protease ATP-binding subunit ClpB